MNRYLTHEYHLKMKRSIKETSFLSIQGVDSVMLTLQELLQDCSSNMESWTMRLCNCEGGILPNCFHSYTLCHSHTHQIQAVRVHLIQPACRHKAHVARWSGQGSWQWPRGQETSVLGSSGDLAACSQTDCQDNCCDNKKKKKKMYWL